MPDKPKKRKGPSISDTAKLRRKTTTKTTTPSDGGRFFDSNANPYSLGGTKTKINYKPKAMSATFGGSVGGKPATIRIKKAKKK